MSDEPNGNGGRAFVTVTNRDIWNELKALRQEVGALSDYPDLKKRVTFLEWMVRGLLAGIVGAIVMIVAKGGIPGV